MKTSPLLRLRAGWQWLLPLCFCLSSQPLLAHTDGDVAGGMMSGLLHPVTGLDHIIAMVAVGLWGAQLERPLLWALPVVFPTIMAVGGALGVRGVGLPGVEIGIALSGVLLGLVVALAFRPSVWAALLLVAFFAIFHGYAHGAELPASGHPLAYGIGFVVATGFLHLAGIGIGALHLWKPVGAALVRLSGAAIMVLGGWFLYCAIVG